MKKILSIIMACVVIITSMLALPATAQAAESYSNSTISANISKIKKYIVKNGFINGNGDYAIQYYRETGDFSYYNLLVVDSDDDSMTFRVNLHNVETDDFLGYLSLEIEPPTKAVMYMQTQFWVESTDYADLGAHAYIDRSFNHKVDFANFYIDFNDENVSEVVAYDLFDMVMCEGFESWDYMLDEKLDLNLGAVGFKAYCGSHKYKTTTTKATLNSNGKKTKTCSICGKIKSTSTIARPDVIKLSATKYTYDGKAKKPSVIVKDSNGKTISSSNYTVKYAEGRKNVGKYSVKVTFKGNYSGSKTLSFTINPASTEISSLSAVSKGFKIKWKKKATQTTGYEIQCATNKGFTKNKKTITISKNSTTSKKITKLGGKKKYYVRIRTYKKVNGTKYYSSWSKVKTVTTKK